MAYSQENTILGVTAPFGDGAVLLAAFHAEERISAPFRFELELISPDRALKFESIIGQGVTVTLRLGDDKTRYFHGVVTRFVQGSRANKETSYRAELRPWLWLLTKTKDSRIFQGMSVPEILEAVFGDHGFSDFKSALKRSYAPREYCVQYQESAFAFVSRLMEGEGIYYYFTHEDGKHTLVFADDSASSPPCPILAEAKYTGEISSAAEQDAVVECTLEQEVVAGGYATSDYNFEMPDTSLLAATDGAGGNLKVFEYPGAYAEKSAGEALAKVRLEEEEALAKRLVGGSLCRAFSAGHAFKLTEHDRDDMNVEYVLLGVVHSATNEVYSNTFEAFPKDVSFRPARVTPKPIIYGAQTALVVGKSGEEIWTDEYGRIKVQFYWDRLGKKDENSSCWTRLAQGWAGKGWGMLFLPRIGQEVLVSFLGGDPDRPIVTGSVYNAQQTVPYTLPGEQNKSTVFSRSTKEGSAGNELRFDDTKDAEELFMHAQKDMLVDVENDCTINIKNEQSVSVGKNQTISVGADRTLSVEGADTTTIKGDRSVTVDEGSESLAVSKGNRSIDVSKGNETHAVKGTRDLAVEGNESHANKGNFSHEVKGDYVLQVKGNLVIEAKAVTIKSEQETTLKAGKELKGLASGELTVKSDKAVTVKGSEVKIN